MHQLPEHTTENPNHQYTLDNPAYIETEIDHHSWSVHQQSKCIWSLADLIVNFVIIFIRIYGFVFCNSRFHDQVTIMLELRPDNVKSAIRIHDNVIFCIQHQNLIQYFFFIKINCVIFITWTPDHVIYIIRTTGNVIYIIKTTDHAVNITRTPDQVIIISSELLILGTQWKNTHT